MFLSYYPLSGILIMLATAVLLRWFSTFGCNCFYILPKFFLTKKKKGSSIWTLHLKAELSVNLLLGYTHCNGLNISWTLNTEGGCNSQEFSVIIIFKILEKHWNYTNEILRDGSLPWPVDKRINTRMAQNSTKFSFKLPKPNS